MEPVTSPAQDETAPDSEAAPVRYIKLGAGGAWARRALGTGEIHLGHAGVSHDRALAGDRAALEADLVALGRSPGTAKSFAREITDFYELGPDALWITFADGHLWWAHAAPEVTWLGGDRASGIDGKTAAPSPGAHGARMRRTLGPWRNTDALGRPLVIDALSTRLTKVASYRQTLCRLDPGVEAYLRRKLRGEEEPAITAALEAKRALVAGAEALIAGLHWADFETLVDLILARGGWHRVSALGGTMKDADLVVEQAVTGETALVQVKSAANQGVLDDYIGRFEAAGTYARLIFACHSPRGSLEAGGREDVLIWARAGLAETAVRHGLVDWLVARSG